MDMIGGTVHPYLSDVALHVALARIFQVKLWIDTIDGVPRAIAARDLQFWTRLLAQSAKAIPDPPAKG